MEEHVFIPLQPGSALLTNPGYIQETIKLPLLVLFLGLNSWEDRAGLWQLAAGK